ncbi:hypothetical protein MTO96_007679 [Rhipicephalus appendiculatus]
MQRRINATKKLVKRAISERSELRSRNTTSDIAEIVESRGDLAKFTIEAYFIVDDELHKRLRSAGRTIQQYARRFAIEVTKLLWQLRPRGCLVVVGAETISPEADVSPDQWTKGKRSIGSQSGECLRWRRCPEPENKEASTPATDEDEKLRHDQCMDKMPDNFEFLNATTPEDDYAIFINENTVDAPKTLGNVANHAKSKNEMHSADAVIYLVG